MNDPRVTVRMYRTGFGDCHLLTFRLPAGVQRNILIDCGYFPGSPFPGITMEKIADDIGKRTGNRLDAIVVTHEHQDHLQGFMDAEEQFHKMALGELWMAWTEKPGQKIVAEKRSIAGLEAAAAGLAFSGGEEEMRMASSIESMLGFAKGTDLAFEKVKSWFPPSSRKYWNPGQVIEPDWLPGVRVYVLGPPKDLTLLHKRTGKKNVEMYELATEQYGFAAAALDEMEPGSLSPFDGKYARDRLPEGVAESYADADAEWRRIDNDWLFSAARLALQLDSYTNNTSLVLAFEMMQSRRVLLFVGDAQIGNWMSWRQVEFQVDHRKVSVADLLARTVFYKVGHHGSHNATLVEGGLLGMTSENLQAAIPTHEEWAQNSRHWEMPNGRLFRELRKRCVHPVLRADRAAAGDLAVEWSMDPFGTPKEEAGHATV